VHSENDKEGSGPKETFTGRDVLYREGAVGLLDVQRAADALLRQGRKPSVAAIREQLGGGSPNTITPLLAKYWEKLGSRLGDGPESLERVPEALARVTELLWRRALEEARERVKIHQGSDKANTGVEELQDQVGKLSIAIAEARAREGEHLAHLAMLSRDREGLRIERTNLLAVLKSSQTLLEQQQARVTVLERARSQKFTSAQRISNSSRPNRRAGRKATPRNPKRALPRGTLKPRKKGKVRKLQ
jgi:hypothetical protein